MFSFLFYVNYEATFFAKLVAVLHLPNRIFLNKNTQIF